MKILTLNNVGYDLNDLPDELEEEIRFSVLDNSTPADPDFYFMPLIFLESFNSPAIVLRIGEHTLQMPLDWCIVVGDEDSGHDPEVLPLTSLNERGFSAFVYNPINGFRVDYEPIEIINIFQDVRWYFPKVKNGQILTTPLAMHDSPPCAFFVKEVSRQCELVQLDKLF